MDDYGEERRVLLGAFATMRKATISFVLPLEELSCDYIFEYFSNVCRENSSIIKI
jgi:hypothetical protein